ncbi:Nucleoporin protein Ndc1-Nup [Dillenia turbinata]|uniref:Nucleoporin protein Ndc1-Nup n=1 Tax=Dillenia turbinata TaxID=194707 RepID=A0AAN8V4K7_9MAGN
MSSPTTEVVKNRYLGFLIWQSIPSTAIFILYRTFSLNLKPSLLSFLTFFVFHLSLLLFSSLVSSVSSPQPFRPASLPELALGLLRFTFISGGATCIEFRRRAKTCLSLILFVICCTVFGSVLVVSVCWGANVFDGLAQMMGLGSRGGVVGLVYGLHYVLRRRWVLDFPIIQRPPFFSFKMGFPFAIRYAMKLSSVSYVLSAILLVFMPDQFKNQRTYGRFIAGELIFCAGSFCIVLCWELCHHLHQVLHTKRFVFAPPKGSAAAETNPSEPLLAALEDSTSRSLLQFLAYLDLYMVCESNVDSWRRAAFFEETGETYKRVVAVCLRPLEQLASRLCEGLEGSVGKGYELSHQLQPPADAPTSKLHEPFDDFQLCAWSAQAVASLTAHSLKEDRFGVAQLSGSNAAAVSTLLSCLLAVETYMGKKTNLQTPHLMGPATIKWAALNPGRRDTGAGTMGKKRDGAFYLKAYAVADVLRTSIYCIVSSFYDEMMSGDKAGLLEKDWIISGKPPCGTRDILLQKLRLFLDFRAC